LIRSFTEAIALPWVEDMLVFIRSKSNGNLIAMWSKATAKVQLY